MYFLGMHQDSSNFVEINLVAKSPLSNEMIKSQDKQTLENDEYHPKKLSRAIDKSSEGQENQGETEKVGFYQNCHMR